MTGADCAISLASHESETQIVTSPKRDDGMWILITLDLTTLDEKQR